MDEHTIENLEKRLSDVEHSLGEIKDLLNKLEGAALFLRAVFYIVGPLMGAAYWMSDHIHWGK